MATGAHYPNVKLQFSDTAGAPLAGGLLYTYSAGTVTPLATYSDSALTVQNANPVVLDAAGRATVYLSAASYFITLKNSAGATVWTQDNVADFGQLFGLSVAAGTAPLAIQSSTFAGLPAAATAGRLSRVTDVKRGLWMDTGTKWFSVSGERPNLIEFQADRTGVADCSAAFRAAVTVQQTGYSSNSVSGQGTTLSTAAIFLPYGIYRLSASINAGVAMNGLRIIGDNAIIELDPGVVFIDSIRYFFYMHGVTVRGGLRHFDIKTGNNECMIVFENCEFMYPSQRIFNVDNNSASTQLLVKKCRLFTEGIPAAQIIVALTSDYIVFEDCFVKVETSAAAAFEVSNTHLFLIRMVGVPQMLYAWVHMKGGFGDLYVDPLCRFGGEDAGTQYAAIICDVGAYSFQEQLSNGIHIDGSEIYSLGPLIHFNAIPNSVIVKNCLGLPGTPPFRIDPSVTAAQLARIGAQGTFSIEYNSFGYSAAINPAGASIIAREGIPLISDRAMMSGCPDTADLVIQSGGNTGSYGPTLASSNATLGTATDQFGVPIRTITATADNGFGSVDYVTALNGLVAGVYTVVFDIEITTPTTVRASFKASNSITWNDITPTHGRHTICIPFFYDGVGSEGYLPKSISIAVLGMPNTAVVRWHRFRVYTGRRHITGPTAEVYGTAAPTTGQWYRGDKVLNSNKTVPGVPGQWMCIIAGTPGDWVCDFKAGSFTMGAVNLQVIPEAEFKFNGGSGWVSKIVLIPNNASAIVLQASNAGLYVVAAVNGVSFSVATGNGVAAAGTEVYQYMVMN